jgi:hypothetical protein
LSFGNFSLLTPSSCLTCVSSMTTSYFHLSFIWFIFFPEYTHFYFCCLFFAFLVHV